MKLNVCAENGTYDIHIGKGLLRECSPGGNYAVVTDETVASLYGHFFEKERLIVLSPGEASKNFGNLQRILDALLEMGLDRKDTVIALGGGVVGDIAGFAAAVYKRGVRFVQIPTTLLAQVDSSVGGKVAVNLDGGKNMAGAFYQPSAVFADTDTLRSLDGRQYAAGMAEVIKYAYIADAALHQKLLADNFSLEEIVYDCCRIKARYVTEDPYDTGVRMQLNYGHTVGHAIETVAGYGNFLHGEAVAVGMVCAAAVGEALRVSPPGLKEDTVRLVRQYGLPTEVERGLLEEACKILKTDKKAEDGHIHFILIDKIGHAVIKKLLADTVAGALKETL